MSEFEAARPGGWYPDPWSGNQHRFWTGTEWTADVFPSGPGFFTRPSPPSPFPPTQRSSTPLPPPVWSPEEQAPQPTVIPPLPASLPPGPSGPPWWRQTVPLTAIAVVLGLLVGVLLTVALTGPSKNSAANTPLVTPPAAAPSTRVPNLTQPQIPPAGSALPTQAPPSDSPAPGDSPVPSDSPAPGAGGSGGSSAPTTPADPTLAKLVLQQSDLSSSLLTVATIPNGQDVSANTATLDICNGTFPSEALRTARLQVSAADPLDNTVLSTEAVRYKNSAATAQAFSELTSVAKACPSTPVTSPVGEPTVISKITAGIDSSWPQTDGVQRLAFDISTTASSGQVSESVGVYLRRGSLLMGVYLPTDSSGALPSVDGATTVQSIAAVFANRLAALPASAVGS